MTPRDPAATKAKLLDAARVEFSEKGIAGARVDAIARRAGVNKQLVYYYFESKAGLFAAILRERLQRPPRVATDDGPGLGDRLATAAEDLVDERDYVRLLMWEGLDAGEGPVEAAEERRAHYARMVEQIEADQAAGLVDPDLDPAQVLLSRVALAMFPVAFPQVTELIAGHPVDSDEFREARRAHFEQVFQPTASAAER